MSINTIEYLGGGTSNTTNKARTEFGQITSAKKEPSQVIVAGFINQLVVPFNYDALPTTSTEDNIIDIIPQNSLLLDAWFYVIEEFLGGVDYTVGTSTPPGVVVDADGIFTAANLPIAVLTPGNWIQGTGAQLGVPLTDDVQITGTANGVFTAGKGKILIRYIAPL